MQKVIYLKEYKQKLIDREKALGKKKSLIDEEANYEDIRFELECEWDKEFDHRSWVCSARKFQAGFILFKWKVL